MRKKKGKCLNALFIHLPFSSSSEALLELVGYIHIAQMTHRQ